MKVDVAPTLPANSPVGQAFDELAACYDEQFTNCELGRLLRQAVWRRLDARFPRGSRVLDLGCGTGEDAVHLARRGVHVVALDAAEAMVAAARAKAATAGLANLVEVSHATIESLADDGVNVVASHGNDAASFDGAFSNFGALNCCATDPASIARVLARRLRTGAPAVLVVMGRLVPWEWVWFIGRGQPRRAFRRLSAGGVSWRGVTVRYPSIRELRRAFAPAFRYLRSSGLGCLLPPSYAARWTLRHPRLLRALDRCERRIEAVPPVAWLADHYVLELERR